MARLLDILFGCWHRNQSLPFGREPRLYRVCLECGKHIPFSFEEVA